MSPIAAFEFQSWVIATEIVGSTMPKIFITCSFMKKVYQMRQTRDSALEIREARRYQENPRT